MVAAFVFGEHGFAVVVFLKIFDEADDFLDTGIDVVGTDIDTFASVGDGGEGGFVEMGGDGVAAVVSFVTYTLAVAVFGDWSSFGKTHADGADENAFGSGFASSGFGIVFEVFTVGNDDDSPALIFDPFTVGVAIAEGFHAFLDGVADGSALSTDQAAVDLVEEKFYGTVVVSQGHLDVAATSKDDEGDAVAAKRGEEVVDGALATFETVGLDVLSHHAVGYVEADGDVAADAFAFYHFATLLGIGESKDEEGGGKHNEAVFYSGTPAGGVGDETAEHAVVGKLFKPTFVADREPYPESHSKRDEEQEP